MHSEHPLPSEEPRSPAEEVLAELFERRAQGARIDIEEYCRLHPELADELRGAHGDLFGLFEELERLGNSYGDRDATVVPSTSPDVDLGPTAALSRQIVEQLTGRKLPSHRYHLRGEVARGGMGAVLRVWDEDLRRSLAMKVILEGSEGSAILREQRLARFLEEAQITGQLDHPGVVPTHELGVDEQGRVYFTMKLVQGRTLEEVIAEAARGEGNWTTTRSIEILVRICEAMAFAHSKGVIHRDLKPANVMVGRFGEVYVMDWGLARVLGRTDRRDLRIRNPDEEAVVSTLRRDAADSDPSSILRTLDGHVVGTPAYMSPEQARAGGQEIDQASDIYSAGAILYHMLVGSMPYVSRTENPSNRAVWGRVLSGPPAPVRNLAPHVPIELVAICEKAMSREISKRYASMEELALDLRAFIEGRVVRAYETGAFAELRKWVRRNRALSAAFAASLFLLFGGMGSVSYVEAHGKRVFATERDAAIAARELASEEKERAESEARKAKDSLNFLQEIFGAVRPERRGSSVTVAEILDDAAKQLEANEGRAPQVDATLHELLGVSYNALGMYQEAARHMQASLDMRIRMDDPDQHEIWRSLNGLGVVYRDLGRVSESEKMLRDGLARIALADGPEDWDTLMAANNLVVTLHAAQKYEQALELGTRTLELQERVWGRDDSETMQTANSVANLLGLLGREKEASAMFAELLERAERILGPENGLTVVIAQNSMYLLAQLGDLDAAGAISAGFEERLVRIFGKDHSNTVKGRGTLALVAIARGEFAQAEHLLRENHEILARTVGPDDDSTLSVLETLGEVVLDQDRYEEAEELFWQVIDRRTELFGERDMDALVARYHLGRLLVKTGRLDEAEPLLRELLDQARSITDLQELDIASCITLLAKVHVDREEWAAAEPLLREALAKQERDLGERNTETLASLSSLGWVLSKLGRSEEAAKMLERALALQTEISGAEDESVQLTRQRLEELDSRR
jgi:serine/threonine protein kinase/tetratricopeptide (TPR) repeat protein